jgi:threonine dehydrogenase-like Zn-dependent dehydrogenase
VGLCGSDLSVVLGRWPAPYYPWIMGHEAFGTIEAVGRDVDSSRLGQLVVIEPNISCDDCAPCRRGRSSACQRRQSVGMNRQGALAERLVVPSDRAWPVAHREPRDLVCLEPLVVVETALRRLPTTLPEEALVVGVGAQGSLMCLALTRRGVRTYVADVNRDRIAFAVDRLGATALHPEDDRRFDLVVDTTGVPDAFRQAMDRSEVGATILELGLHGRQLELTSEALVRGQFVLVGSLTYDHPDDFQRGIALVTSGAVAPGLVINDEYGLAEAQRAFESSTEASGKTWIRLAIGPDGDSAGRP